jgi:prephenate dehydratase
MPAASVAPPAIHGAGRVAVVILPTVTAAAAPPPTSPEWETRTIAFLGPIGTFSEQALHTEPDLARATLVPMPTFSAVLNAVEQKDVDLGFVAIENAIEGTVNVTQDTLAFDADLLIQREVVLPVHLDLMVRPGVALSDVTHVWSYPHALAQCRKFLARELPLVEPEASNSTADAARMLAEHDDRHSAAIAPGRAAEVYGLEVVAHAIEDHDDNATRFVLVARDGVPAPSGHDKTSIVVFQRADEPGSLLAILQEFAARGINLTRLESRPTRRGLGDYCFLIDLEGHLRDEVVTDALRSLKTKQADVKFLGSYPAAGEHGPAVRQEADEAAQRAEAWLTALRSGISPTA